jgi:hypothetical protein
LSVTVFLKSGIPTEKIKEESILKYKGTLSTLSVSVSSLGDFNNALIRIFDEQNNCSLLEFSINDIYQSSNPIIPALKISLDEDVYHWYFPSFGMVEITNINILKQDMTELLFEGIIYFIKELLNRCFNCFIISSDIVVKLGLNKINDFFDFFSVEFDFNNNKYYRFINDRDLI